MAILFLSRPLLDGASTRFCDRVVILRDRIDV